MKIKKFEVFKEFFGFLRKMQKKLFYCVKSGAAGCSVNVVKTSGIYNYKVDTLVKSLGLYGIGKTAQI